MKILKLTFLSMVIFGTLNKGFCQPNNQNPIDKTQQKLMKTKKVKACFVAYYEVKDGNEAPTSDFDSLYYDQHGNLIYNAWSFTTTYSHYKDVERYFYNAQNNIVVESIDEYDEEEKTDSTREIHVYDKKGLLVKSYYYDNGVLDDSCSYHYNKKNQLLSGVEFGTKMECTYKKDTMFLYRGDHELSACYVKDRQLFSQSGVSRWTYQHNSNGLIIGSKTTKSGVLAYETVYEYKNGLINKVITTRYDTKITEIEYYTYSYFE